MCKCNALPTCFSQTGTKCAVLLVKTETEPLPSNTTLCYKCRTSFKRHYVIKTETPDNLSYF